MGINVAGFAAVGAIGTGKGDVILKMGIAAPGIKKVFETDIFRVS